MPVVIRAPGWRHWAPHFGFLLVLGSLFIVDSLCYFVGLLFWIPCGFWAASGGKVLRERGPGSNASGKKGPGEDFSGHRPLRYSQKTP